MDRDVPESRLGGCPHQIYSDDLPTTSIIITFHNELRSTLLRTIISVLRRTPAKILKEIVLVDDASADSSIGTALTQIEKVKLVVNRQREGLIRARIRAAMVAEGDTLTFLDSHVEVNEMWIEPLMAKIKANEKMVVAPIIGGKAPRLSYLIQLRRNQQGHLWLHRRRCSFDGWRHLGNGVPLGLADQYWVSHYGPYCRFEDAYHCRWSIFDW